MALRLHSLTCSITYNGLMDCNIATVQGGVCLQRCIKLPKSQIATIPSHMAIQIARARLTWGTPYWHALGLEKALQQNMAECGFCQLETIKPTSWQIHVLRSKINVTLIVTIKQCAGTRWNRAFLFRRSIAEMTSEPWTIVLLFCDLWELDSGNKLDTAVFKQCTIDNMWYQLMLSNQTFNRLSSPKPIPATAFCHSIGTAVKPL